MNFFYQTVILLACVGSSVITIGLITHDMLCIISGGLVFVILVFFFCAEIGLREEPNNKVLRALR